ncbi:hypothetical protein E4U17_008139 [Claviceps sp. LM77 group G4]|nr:hypothetical protein E4U17_008139 [Claviceps sp. LM77 group G4]KAG6065107.1 hypothetical protein E4U33_005968 [Claviceps sp. LM78 group G4]KAG6072067.1 hypothetical protein E4U16_005669 [Claviceps sp. LM84 group G4]
MSEGLIADAAHRENNLYSSEVSYARNETTQSKKIQNRSHDSRRSETSTPKARTSPATTHGRNSNPLLLRRPRADHHKNG